MSSNLTRVRRGEGRGGEEVKGREYMSPAERWRWQWGSRKLFKGDVHGGAKLALNRGGLGRHVVEGGHAIRVSEGQGKLSLESGLIKAREGTTGV